MPDLDDKAPRKIRLELLDGTVEVTGSESFLRRAQTLIGNLVSEQKREPAPLSQDPIPASPPCNVNGSVVDIRSLRDQKQPRNVVEMAAVTAYYVSATAPPEERRESIDAEDIKKFFGQAEYTTTTAPRNILFQAKSAGYLDSAGRGQYKLNPVGYNLVTAGLPSQSTVTRKRRATKHRRPKGKKT